MKQILLVILTSNVCIIIYLFLWQQRNPDCKSGNLKKCARDISNGELINREEHANKLLITTNDLKANSMNSSQNPTLVIFTTFKATSDHHRLAHRLVISNWNTFGGAVKPVLFANLSITSRTDPENVLVTTALENGWDVLPLESANSYGTPYLRPMYGVIFKRYNASFYGYANGDLLFTNKLLKSLQFLNSILKEKLSSNVLLVGRRTDVQLFRNLSSVSTDNTNEFNSSIFTTDFEIYENYFSKSNLPELAKKGVLKGPRAIDYFFFTRENSTFNWSAIANVVIGRRAYDKYLIAMAIRFGVNTVDLSRTVLAVHLSKPGFPNTGFLNVDTNFNSQVIGKFTYSDGLINTTHYFLQQNVSSSEILLTERKRKIVANS